MALAVVALATLTPASAASKRALLLDIGASSVSRSANPQVKQGLAEARALATRNGKVRIIVGLKVAFAPEGALPETERKAQRSEIVAAATSLRAKMASHGMASARSFASAPFMALQVTASQLDYLSQQPEVLSITVDTKNQLFLAQSTQVVGAPTAWSSGYTGAGKTVAVLDTGVESSHPFLAGKVVSEACYSGGGDPLYSTCPGQVLAVTGPGTGAPCGLSNCDHGTHVAGIAAGTSASFSGVAKGAQLIAINVMSTDGIWDSDLMAALQRVYDLRNTYSIASVNMSLGGGGSSTYCDATPLKAYIDNLRSANIATVIASGNNGFINAISYPACISSAVSVGATWDSPAADSCGAAVVDTVACFSNSASILSLLAPGTMITSSVPGGAYDDMQGTSMATPHVAGAWAVARQALPNASVSEVLSALKATGKPVLDTWSNVTTPRIDLAAFARSVPIALGAASYSVSEAAATVTIPVTRVNTSDAAAVGYSVTNGSAVIGSDFGGVASGTLSFTPGATTAAITVPIVNDQAVEPDETFTVVLNAVSPNYAIASPSSATVTIINDDKYISLKSARYTVLERKRVVRVYFTRTHATGAASVKYTTVNGTATSANDYRARTGRVNFASGARTAYVDIVIYNDSRREAAESFTLKISSPSSGYKLGTLRASRITIANDD